MTPVPFDMGVITMAARLTMCIQKAFFLLDTSFFPSFSHSRSFAINIQLTFGYPHSFSNNYYLIS